MIIPDTNVISELMREGADPRVIAWVDRQAEQTLFLASPVLAELLLGAAVLPKGFRRDSLTATIEFVIRRRFAARIRPFDERVARQFARIIADAQRVGRSIAVMDGQIAAIAAAHGATVATRDTAPFAAAGIPTINPWLPTA